MSKLVSDKPKVAVIFENTAFGTSTSNGLKELAPGEGVEIVMFEPYSAGFTDASPLINKVKSSGANALFSVSYLNDLILIVRTVKQVGLNIAINGGSGGFVIPDFYKNVGKLAEGLQGVAHWNHDMSDDAQKVNAEYKKRTGEFLFEYAGGLVAQTFMLADALERAGSADPQKVREALSTLDVSSGYAAMAPGGKVKFGPDGKNVYGHPVGVQWQNGDLASVFPEGRRPRAADENLNTGPVQMWETVAQAVINGLLIGGIYALVSIGVTLIFGVVKIVNFAQGEFVMIGMYISLLPRQPVRHRSAAVAVRLDAGAVRGRRADPAFPDPPGAGPERHAADLPDLRAVAAAAESRADAVQRQLPHRPHLLFRRSLPSRRALYPRGKADRLRRRDGAERRALGVPAHHRSRQGDARGRRRTATSRC